MTVRSTLPGLCTVLSHIHRMCACMIVDLLKAPPNPGESAVLGPGRLGKDPRRGVVRLAGLSISLSLTFSTPDNQPVIDTEWQCVCRVSI